MTSSMVVGTNWPGAAAAAKERVKLWRRGLGHDVDYKKKKKNSKIRKFEKKFGLKK